MGPSTAATPARHGTGSTPKIPFKVNMLTWVDSFDTQGKVTGADASPDGRRLAVLTYDGVWVFDAKQTEGWFDGIVRWMPLQDDDQEGLAMDGNNLIISADEGDGDLYEIPISKLQVVRP